MIRPLPVALIRRIWRNLRLRYKGLIVILVPTLCLSSAVLVLDRMHVAEQQARSAVERALGVRAQAEQTLALLRHAETSMQAYLSTGSRRWMEEFEGTSASVSGRIVEIERAVADSSEQRQRTHLIARLVTDRLQVLRVWSAQPERPPEPTAGTRRLANTERAVYASLQHELGVMIAAEDGRLEASEAHVTRLARLRSVAVPIGLAVGVVGGFGAMLLFTSGISDRVHLSVERVRRFVQEGAASTASPEADDEIGQLERGLADASILLAERERQLRQARDEAEAANVAKNEFLSRMSHELRTPLNSVIGFGQILEMTLSGADADAARHVVGAGRHLLGLINEILDIAKIEAGYLEMSPEPIPLAEVVWEAVDLITPLADERQIQIRIDPVIDSVTVRADRQRLTQILLNLLSNAVKYNRDGGCVDVRADVQDRTPAATDSGSCQAHVSIQIVDTGVGIDPDLLTRVFTPFDRLGAEQRGIEGTGLGLTLSKRLAEAMSGTVQLTSEPNRGTTVRVTLPAAADAARAPDLQAMSLVADRLGTSRTVLYIEDNLANVTLVERITAFRPGLRLLVAMTARAGLELAQHHRPEVILLDLHLPDAHGQQVLRTLRTDPATRDTPIVVVSADATPGQVERALANGATRYLPKPLDVAALLSTLDSLFRRPAA
ncbi:MAG: ATP-binding protein [Vicinamibacterales bacterium]